jgi:hypothetical protein
LAGRNPNRKCIYASYAEALGTRMSLNLQRTFKSDAYQGLFPYIRVDVPGWTANTDLTEFCRFRGSLIVPLDHDQWPDHRLGAGPRHPR